jgi:hypothetical protein
VRFCGWRWLGTSQFHDWIRGRLLAGPMTSFRQLERTLWNAGLHAGSVERRRATFCPSIDLSSMRLNLGIRKLHQSENGNSKSQHLFFKLSDTSQWKSLKTMVATLSCHPGFRYWWPNRPLQCRAETRLKTNKSADEAGLVAELVHVAPAELIDIALLF